MSFCFTKREFVARIMPEYSLIPEKDLENVNLQSEQKTSGIQARTILWYLIFLGLATDYMNRISMKQLWI